MIRRFAIHLLVCMVLPPVAWWVWRRERFILRHGRCLTDAEQQAASRIAGVRHVARIRVHAVPHVPMPGWDWMHRLAERMGRSPAVVGGMALRYGICVRIDCQDDPGILLHECVHTGQYERLGSLRAFLHQYLLECLRDGYGNSLLEAEARRVR